MSKITKQEFENWSQDFSKKMANFIVVFSSQISETEKEQLIETRALIQVAVEAGNTFAVASFLKMVENWTTGVQNKVYSDTGGLTLRQWLDNLKNRLKEHAEVGGYYKPNQPMDLPSLKERWKKLFKLWKDDEQRVKVIPYLSDEDREFVVEVVFFVNKGKEIIGSNTDEKAEGEMVEEYFFLVEDLCGRVEAAQKKLEQAERERERERRSQPFSYNPQLSPTR
ncbi:protein of unknown function [endosymbiont DhMRE of Dentiscutata heterogama]|uniref:hypothetical protein n=1 Tax=endosymbiont DhMRE of Dentiscutata heterogama TaxID=1609546 RepID=UPI000629D3FF|nr:hypothetical protein [endosymbiont DhMRE of Dentiscutata heterogama]CFW93046.1 protein of unknown function [endosymbiont DhMRE of Dentiscutata heterogama]